MAPFDFEHPVSREDGGVEWALVCAVPIIDAKGWITELFFGAAIHMPGTTSAKRR